MTRNWARWLNRSGTPPFRTAAFLIAILSTISGCSATPQARGAHEALTGSPTATSSHGALRGKSRAPSQAKLPRLASTTETSAIGLDTRIGSYQARDAVWVSRQPLLVGRDYDFGIALAVDDGVGPALAAFQRKQFNQAYADRLSSVPSVDASASLSLLLNGCTSKMTRYEPRRAPLPRCTQLARTNVLWVYGVLFGEQDARLRVVVELLEHDGERQQYVAVGAARPLSSFAAEATLRRDFLAGTRRIVELLDQPSLGTAAGPTALCPVGGSELARGRVVGRRDGLAVLRLADPTVLPTLLICPESALRAQAEGAT